MQQINGMGISGGIATGRIFFYEKTGLYAERRTADDVHKETERFKEALNTAKDQIDILYERSLKEMGEKAAAVFEAHLMILEDAGLYELIVNTIINDRVCAEYAVYKSGQEYAQKLSGSGDEYFMARAEDMADITRRLLQNLKGKKDTKDLPYPVLIMSEEITASDTAGFDRDKILGFISHKGSAYSHAAIFSRNMNIPAMSGIKPDASLDGKVAVLDGYNGILTVDPDEAALKAAEERMKEENDKAAKLKAGIYDIRIKGSGRRIKLLANIGRAEEAVKALECGAEGIGLFRSEFLFMNRNSLPSEEEQFRAYKAAAETMSGKEVVIRTIDLGADKKAECIKLDEETDPALGYRALRICFDRPDIFKTQLRAIYRASAYGEVSVLFPMIVSADEFLKCRKYTEEVMEDLKREGIAFSNDLKLGAMIETPAAALISDELAGSADFFSIGSNDLTQYTLAADRNNDRLRGIYDPHHPAVLKLIEMSVNNAHSHGKLVCLCGELASDISFIRKAAEIGIDELSVSLSALLNVRSELNSL